MRVARGGTTRKLVQRNRTRPDVGVEIVVTSALPNAFTAGGATHRLTAEVRNGSGAALSSTFNFVSTDASKASVAAVTGGADVTPVAAGTANIEVTSVEFPYLPKAVAPYTVVGGAPTVATLVISATVISVNNNTTVVLSAIPKDAGGNVVLNEIVTWSKTNGTGTGTIGADSGNDLHQAVYSALTSGTVTIQAHCGVIDSAVCTATNSAATWFVDNAGVEHPLCPATGIKPILGRVYGRRKDATNLKAVRLGHAGLGLEPYMKNVPIAGSYPAASAGNGALTTIAPAPGATEGWNDPGESASIRIITDPSGPMQNLREQIYPGESQLCALYEVLPGTAGNNTFAGTQMHFTDASTNRYPAAWGINQHYRQMFSDRAIKFRPDFPIFQNLTKFDFWGIAQTNNAAMLQLPSYSQWGFNPQGTLDNALNDAHVLTNADWGSAAGLAAGLSRTSNVVDGHPFIFAYGKWYRILRRIRMSTYPSTRDGYLLLAVQELITPGIAGVSQDIWSTPFLVAGDSGWTGLRLLLTNATGQQYMTGFNPAFMLQTTFNGTGRFGRSGNHGVQSLTSWLYQVAGAMPVLTFPSGVTITPPTGMSIPTGKWASGRIDVNNTGPSGAVRWFNNTEPNFTNSGPGYDTESAAASAARSQPVSGREYAGYFTLQAGAATWLAGTDALAGGTGGIPAAVTNYWWSTGIHVSHEFVAGAEIV